MFGNNLTTDWMTTRLSRNSIYHLARYAFSIFVPNFKATSVFGFALLINMVTQFFSGFLLSLYYVPDPSFVITFREEYTREV
jgi:quinol-cytochrome oxidoreductase complex cytochrome b subunit